MPLYHRFILLGLLSMLTACASSPAPKATPSDAYPHWQAHQARLNAITHWQVSGRIFMQTQDDGFSSQIDWVNRDQIYQIRFTAPMGQGVYDLQGEPGKVSMTMPNNQTETASNPESLMQKTLGVSLPVSGLSYWLRGLPNPANSSRDILLDTHERLIRLEQQGWKIIISRYRQQGDIYLPDKLIMENKHVKIKMALKDWRIDQETVQ